MRPFLYQSVIRLLLASGIAALPAQATELAPPPKPELGSSQFASAELLTPRPAGTPCVVELFGSQDFIGDQAIPFSYAPPTDCSGPWSKVVVEADYDVTAGRQFDRTALINIDGVNLYFGTTMEPRRDIAQTWHVERDVTDYANFLRQPHKGETWLANYVDATYTGHIYGRARLLFYPAAAFVHAEPQPQFVAPLAQHVARLSLKDAPTLTSTISFPRNIERLYLDIINEPQADDEFWYGCVDDRFAAGRKDVCGGGSLRETEVSIDGVLAGVAPVYPWIYTGGINPYLWYPIPGLQTVNFAPYRVNLTPFAAQLNDGKPHTIAISVVGLRQYALVTGTLLAWLDQGSAIVTGGVTKNTLEPSRIQVRDKGLTADKDGLDGRSQTQARRHYEIAGFINTSHGRVATRVRQDLSFVNDQTMASTADNQSWTLAQSTKIVTRTKVVSPAGVTTATTLETFPLSVNDHLYSENGLSHEDIKLTQGLQRRTMTAQPGSPTTIAIYDAALAPELRAQIDPATHATHKVEGQSIETVRVKTGDNHCYQRTLESRDNVIYSVQDLPGCPGN